MINSPIPNTESKVVKEPVGVVTQITPWNYPLLQASWKPISSPLLNTKLITPLGKPTSSINSNTRMVVNGVIS
jgi:hypothetical protein